MASPSASSSLALRCRRIFLNTAEDDSKFFNPLRKKQMMRTAYANLQIGGRSLNAITTTTTKMSMTTASCFFIFSAAAAATVTRMDKEEKSNDDREPVSANKLDEWMRDSVAEIVRNIGEAPFLAHLYSNSNEEGKDGSLTRMEREPAVTSEDWPRICRRWKENSTSKPDGVILVEQLKGAADVDGGEEEEERRRHQCSTWWGIVIQGRGLDRAAFYILETSRVRSSVGFCTHFCLIRAKCFGPAAELQLRDAWLLQQQ